MSDVLLRFRSINKKYNQNTPHHKQKQKKHFFLFLFLFHLIQQSAVTNIILLRFLSSNLFFYFTEQRLAHCSVYGHITISLDMFCDLSFAYIYV
jgi:hypothetical protein